MPIYKRKSIIFANIVLFHKSVTWQTFGGRHGHDRMVVGFTTITTDVVSSNLYQGEVYNIMW
jgi:hypothetical protein